jgi:hypothetical protein
MIFDYLDIVPAIVASLIALVALAPKEVPGWRKVVVGALLLVAIAATVAHRFSTAAKTEHERVEKATIREQLGKFELEGAKLIASTLNNDTSLPQDDARKWASDVDEFLGTKLDQSYVIRFHSDSGIPVPGTPFGIQISRLGLLQWLHFRMARLDQFASEISR